MNGVEPIGHGAERVFRAALDTTQRSTGARAMSNAEVGLVLARENQRSSNSSSGRRDMLTQAMNRINSESEQVFNAIFDRRA